MRKNNFAAMLVLVVGIPVSVLRASDGRLTPRKVNGETEISKNPDFSTYDTEFIRNDLLYLRFRADNIDDTNIRRIKLVLRVRKKKGLKVKLSYADFTRSNGWFELRQGISLDNVKLGKKERKKISLKLTARATKMVYRFRHRVVVTEQLPALAWAATYGNDLDDIASSIQQTRDGGYIVAGRKEFFGAGGSEVWVMKLKSDGSVAWQKSYGGGDDDEARSIHQTRDGGYIVAGRTRSFGNGLRDIWVLKLSSNGSVAWEKTYGGAGGDEPYSIQQTADGGYIVAGKSDSFDLGSPDILVLKLNSDGSVAWQKTYGGPDSDAAYSVQQTTDGGYIVAGSTGTLDFRGDDIWVLKLNSDGSVAWQKSYGGASAEEAYSIQQTADGGYIVAGYRGGDFWVLKLNSDGSVAWQKSYGGPNWEEAHSVEQTLGGGYIVAGETYSFGAGLWDILVLKLNNDGSIAWQKSYGGGDDDKAHSIRRTADEGYIVGGWTGSFGARPGLSGDFWVLKLDSNGGIGPLCDFIEDSGAVVMDTYAEGRETTARVRDTTIVPMDTTAEVRDTDAVQKIVCSSRE